MEQQPSEECTEGAKTCVQKALLGHGPLQQTLSPSSQCEEKEREKKGMIPGVLTLKAPSYPHAFSVNVAGRKCISITYNNRLYIHATIYFMYNY